MSSTEALPILSDAPMPYCRGCSHGQIARSIAAAMERTELPPGKLCLVSDIGCVGLVDRLFPTIHTVHTTHGRSPAFAAGLSIADGVLFDGALKTVVVIGDGGATIGLLQLAAAAQLNVDITVVIHNNHLYGMTGGQASGLTPQDWTTATTEAGNPLPPFDLAALLAASGATYIARKVAMDRDLTDRIQEAMDHPGFSVVEVLGLCLPFGVKWNAVTGKKLHGLAEETGPTGVAVQRSDRPPYRDAYRALYGKKASDPVETAHESAESVEPSRNRLDRPFRLVLAGTAGERVQSAARLSGQTAVAAGMYATQKNDNLVTQGTGFSLSELILSPTPIHYTGIDAADALVAVSQDGLGQLIGRRMFDKLVEGGTALVDASLDLPPELEERVTRLPLRKAAKVTGAATAALGWLFTRTGAVDVDAVTDTARAAFGAGAKSTVKALEWGRRAATER